MIPKDYLLQTERLYLIQYKAQDLEQLYQLLSEPTTMQFWEKPYDRAGAENWLNRQLTSYSEKGYGRYALIEKSTGQMVGDAGLMYSEVNEQMENDLGYIIHHTHWRKGFGYEAAKGILEYATNTLALQRIVANMPHDHTASEKVAIKLGMTKECSFYNKRNRNILTNLYVS